MPPLRRRRQDIPVLVGRFVAEFEGANTPHMVVEPALMWALINHPWARNVDELRSVVEAACVEAVGAGGQLQLSARLRRLLGDSASGLEADVVEARAVTAPRSRSQLLAVLREHDFVISRVADHFGKHRQQVYRWMDRFGIERTSNGTNKP